MSDFRPIPNLGSLTPFRVWDPDTEDESEDTFTLEAADAEHAAELFAGLDSATFCDGSAVHVRVRNMTTDELVTIEVAVEYEPIYTITIVPYVETETISS